MEKAQNISLLFVDLEAALPSLQFILWKQRELENNSYISNFGLSQ